MTTALSAAQTHQNDLEVLDMRGYPALSHAALAINAEMLDNINASIADRLPRVPRIPPRRTDPPPPPPPNTLQLEDLRRQAANTSSRRGRFRF